MMCNYNYKGLSESLTFAQEVFCQYSRQKPVYPMPGPAVESQYDPVLLQCWFQPSRQSQSELQLWKEWQSYRLSVVWWSLWCGSMEDGPTYCVNSKRSIRHGWSILHVGNLQIIPKSRCVENEYCEAYRAGTFSSPVGTFLQVNAYFIHCL